MEIKSVNDLKTLDPKLLEQLNIRKVSADEIAKLGLQILNAGDAAKLITRPFRADEFAKQGLKNIHTKYTKDDSAKLGFNKFNQNTSQQAFDSHFIPGSQADVPDKSAEKLPEEADINKEKDRMRIMRPPYPRRPWPFWRYPRPRRIFFGFAPKQEEGDENSPQNTDLPEETQEPAPLQANEINQNTAAVNVPGGKNEDEKVPGASQKNAGDQDEAQEVEINGEDNNIENIKDILEDTSEGNSKDIFEEDKSEDASGNYIEDLSNEEEGNHERVFQLESIKKGIEIKGDPCRVIPLKVFMPKNHTSAKIS